MTAEIEILEPVDRVRLKFRDPEAISEVSDPIHRDLSTAARAGQALFVSCDETAGVDRLIPTRKGWGKHEHFGLGEIFDLPDGPEGEMDIEGLAVDDGWLWIVGSHSLKRDKPDEEDGRAKALRRMARLKRDPNRAFLGRVPLAMRDGVPVPVARDGKRRAACLRLFEDRSKLKHWLRGDPHVGPFLDIPSKENGLDIEGIEVRGTRIWLGLRGPVLREHGIVLELDLKVTKRGWLKARRIDGRARYRKHLICTQGQGIRDLAFDGDDLMILTGTVMTGDGPSDIWRWRDAVGAQVSGLKPVEHVANMPYRGEVDHPEGLVRWPEGGGNAWLVVYDSPSDDRLHGDAAKVDADVMRLT